MLGFTQTGKTCIAANFANRNGFTGADKFSQDFLQEHGVKINKMRSGDMSDPFPANLPGRPDVLQFKDNYSDTTFSFEEYAGEMLVKDNGAIDKLDIPGKDGVLLLLSAREPICGSEQSIEQRKSEIKESFADIVTELAKNPKPIIFVITAADVLLDNTVDHQCFFELKKHIEERIKRNKLEITATKFVSIVESYEGNKVFASDGSAIGVIVPPEKIIAELAENIKNKKNEAKKKKMKKFGIALLIAALAIVLGCCVFTRDTCNKCDNDPCICSTECEKCGKTPCVCGRIIDKCNECDNKKEDCICCLECKKADCICCKECKKADCICCKECKKAKCICIVEFNKLSLDGKFNKFEESQVQDKLVPALLEAIAKEWEPVLNTSPDKYYGNKEFFNNLNKRCRQVRNLENAKINQSNIGKFAEKYIEWYRENIVIKVTGIEFKKSEDVRGIIKNISLEQCFLGVEGKNESASTVQINKKALPRERTVPIYTSIEFKPWEKPFLWISWKHNSIKPKTTRIYFNPHGKTKFDCAPRMTGFAYVNVTFEIVTGDKTFTQLLNDVFGTEKPDIDAIKGSDDDE